MRQSELKIQKIRGAQFLKFLAPKPFLLCLLLCLSLRRIDGGVGGWNHSWIRV